MLHRLTSAFPTAVALAGASLSPLTAQVVDRPPSGPFIIPQPVRVVPQSGTFAIDAETRIGVSDPSDEELLALAEYMARIVFATVGIQVPVLHPEDA